VLDNCIKSDHDDFPVQSIIDTEIVEALSSGEFPDQIIVDEGAVMAPYAPLVVIDCDTAPPFDICMIEILLPWGPFFLASYTPIVLRALSATNRKLKDTSAPFEFGFSTTLPAKNSVTTTTASNASKLVNGVVVTAGILLTALLV